MNDLGRNEVPVSGVGAEVDCRHTAASKLALDTKVRGQIGS